MERVSPPTSPTVPGATTAEVIVRTVVEVPVSNRRRLATGGALILVGLVCALLLGVGSRSGYDASFQLAPADASVKVPNLTLPARLTGILLGLVVVGLGVFQIARGFSRRAMTWVLTATGLCFMVSFLCWSATGGSKGGTLDLLGLMQQSIFLAIPLILGALAGVLCERSGVINVAIEGQMLSGAFAGALIGTLAHNNVVGIFGAVIAGGMMGLLLAVFSIRYYVNQVVLGVVLNVLALGLTGFLYDALMQPNPDTLNNPGFFGPIKIPVLGDIPIVGPLLFNTNLIVYVTYVLIVVIDVALFRTRWGLRTRAVGEHPKAADTVGINVFRTRYRSVIYGGMVAGLAGAFLTIGAVGAFSKNISSGKGFIALAAVIFGRWSPRGAIGAALLFGFADALQTVLSFTQTPVTIPSSFLSMLPYLATLFAVAGLVGRVRAPAADGEPYVKG
jgi:general nucleoside transport system permease protein